MKSLFDIVGAALFLFTWLASIYASIRIAKCGRN